MASVQNNTVLAHRRHHCEPTRIWCPCRGKTGCSIAHFLYVSVESHPNVSSSVRCFHGVKPGFTTCLLLLFLVLSVPFLPGLGIVMDPFLTPRDLYTTGSFQIWLDTNTTVIIFNFYCCRSMPVCSFHSSFQRIPVDTDLLNSS